jgi:hypothetical protein
MCLLFEMTPGWHKKDGDPAGSNIAVPIDDQHGFHTLRGAMEMYNHSKRDNMNWSVELATLQA